MDLFQPSAILIHNPFTWFEGCQILKIQLQVKNQFSLISASTGR